MLQYEYAREALKNGLKLEAKLGTNPYKFGLQGATDSHTALTTAEEENFFGKHSGAEPHPERAEHIFGGSLAYAILRYHLAGDVAWAHFPLFILNKATSLAAVIFVACAYLVGTVIHWHDHDMRLRLVVIKFCGLTGFFLAGAHALFALALLSPAYYAKYFDDDGRLNLQGELALAVGVVALFLLISPAITTLPMMPKALGGHRWKRSQRAGYAALILVVVHLVGLGSKGWIAPKDWPAWIPPISLVAVIAAIIPLLVKRKRIREKRERDEGGNA